MELRNQIRDFRRRFGWTQDDLARQLGVSQKTLSKWESGESNPSPSNRRVVMDLLVSEEAPLKVSGVSETDLLLPLDQLAPDTFESFCADLLDLDEKIRSVTRLGGDGETQWGIDGHAEDCDGRFGWQAKRVRRLSFSALELESAKMDKNPNSPERAVAMMSSRASAALRNDALESRWTIVDVDDISRKVRRLPRERSTQFLLAYFPHGTVARFLGGSLPVLRKPSDLLSNRLEPESLLSLTGPYQEPGELLSQLMAGATRITLISAGVGQGKTRLLLELERRYPDRQVVMLNAGPLKNLSEISGQSESCVILIDDLHDRDDHRHLAQLLSQTQAKVIGTFRPTAGSSPFDQELSRMGLKSTVLELPELSPSQKELLVRDLWPEIHPFNAAELVEQVGDCLAALSVGVQLARASDSTDGAAQVGALRNAILSEINNFVESRQDAALALKFVETVALGGPFPIDAMPELAAELGTEHWRLERLATAAKNLGLMRESRLGYRVSPMVAADAMAGEVLGQRREDPLQMLSRLPIDPARVILNACRARWSLQPAQRDQILEQLARNFLRPNGNTARSIAAALRAGRPVAALIPEHTRDLIEMALPVSRLEYAPDHEEPIAFGSSLTAGATRIEWPSETPSSTSLRDEISASLGALVHDQQSSRYAIRHLLTMAESDSRPSNQFPRHPVRILQQISDLSSEYSEAAKRTLIAEVSASIDRNHGGTGHLYSVFSSLVGLFAREARLQYRGSESIRMTSMEVLAERTAVVRRETKALCVSYLERSDRTLRGSAEAITLLGHDLSYPPRHVNCGHDQTDDDQWVDWINETLDQLDELINAETNATLRLVIRDQLHWHARYGSGILQSRAADMWAVLDEELGVRTAALLLPNRFGMDCIDEMSFEDEQRRSNDKAEHLAADVVSNPGAVDRLIATARDLTDVSSGHDSDLLLAQYTPQSGNLIARITRRSAEAILELIGLEGRGEEIQIAEGLAALRGHPLYEEAIETSRQTAMPEIYRSLGFGQVGDWEVELFREGLASNDPNVLDAVGIAARNMLLQKGRELLPDVAALDDQRHVHVVHSFLDVVFRDSAMLKLVAATDAMSILSLISAVPEGMIPDTYGRLSVIEALSAEHPVLVASELVRDPAGWGAVIFDSHALESQRGASQLRFALIESQPLQVQIEVLAVVRTALLSSTGSEHAILGTLYESLVGVEAVPISTGEIRMAICRFNEFHDLLDHMNGRLFISSLATVHEIVEHLGQLEPVDEIKVSGLIQRRILTGKSRVIPHSGSDPHLEWVAAQTLDLIAQCQPSSPSARFLSGVLDEARSRNEVETALSAGRD